jgi:hypothetical protein
MVKAAALYAEDVGVQVPPGGLCKFNTFTENIMFEYVKHFLGLCGEHWHPSLMTILMGGTAIVPSFVYMKSKFKKN